jgi:hypothetical protein
LSKLHSSIDGEIKEDIKIQSGRHGAMHGLPQRRKPRSWTLGLDPVRQPSDDYNNQLSAELRGKGSRSSSLVSSIPGTTASKSSLTRGARSVAITRRAVTLTPGGTVAPLGPLGHTLQGTGGLLEGGRHNLRGEVEVLAEVLNALVGQEPVIMPPAVANGDIFLALKALHELEDLQIGDLERWRESWVRELSAERDTISHLGELGMLGKVVIALGLEDALCTREGEREFRSLPSESIGHP